MSLRIVFRIRSLCHSKAKESKQCVWRNLQTRETRGSSLPVLKNAWKYEGGTWRSSWASAGACTTGFAVLGWYLFDKRERSLRSVHTLQAAEDEAKVRKVSLRERRYKDFSSVMYHGEPYMTGRDFLEAITKQAPRCECCC